MMVLREGVGVEKRSAGPRVVRDLAGRDDALRCGAPTLRQRDSVSKNSSAQHPHYY